MFYTAKDSCNITMARGGGLKKRAQGRGPRLVFFPCPLEGHLRPMLNLATLLHSKGFSITVIHTYFNSPDPSKYPHDFRFLPIEDGSQAEHAAVEDLMGLISALNVDCEVPFHDALTKTMAEKSPDEEPVMCIISDALMHFTRAVAGRLKLPTFIFRTSSMSSFVTCAAFPMLRQKGYLPVQDPQSETLVSELPPLRIMDLPNIASDKMDNMYQLVANMINETKTSIGVISNSFDFLEPSALDKVRQEFPFPVFQVGPLHKHPSASCSSLLAQDPRCMTWLDKQAPQSVIYVSLGSLVVLTESQLVEMAYGLANSGQHFLWVVRPGCIKGSSFEFQLPEGFQEKVEGRGKIVSWAPQQEVLAHPAVGGFWTHCGWNSTLESLSEGVPMLCWPCFGDQRVNARFVNHAWRVGLQLDVRLDRVNIDTVIRRLMTTKEGEEMRERAKVLKENAELCLIEGGSSYEALKKLVHQLMSL